MKLGALEALQRRLWDFFERESHAPGPSFDGLRTLEEIQRELDAIKVEYAAILYPEQKTKGAKKHFGNWLVDRFDDLYDWWNRARGNREVWSQRIETAGQTFVMVLLVAVVPLAIWLIYELVPRP